MHQLDSHRARHASDRRLRVSQSRQLGEVPPHQLTARDATILLSAQASLAAACGKAYKDMTHDTAEVFQSD